LCLRITTLESIGCKVDHRVSYNLGIRDGLACSLAIVRAEGIAKGLQIIAEVLLEGDRDSPHAKWILENPDISGHNPDMISGQNLGKN